MRSQSPSDGTGLERAFSAALDALVADLRQDRAVLAAILCGSFSHDTVWEKSDIDLVLVTIDDRLVPAGDAALFADGVTIHALLVPRTEFRKAVVGSVRNSFLHSFLAKGRLLYTHDPTIGELCASLQALGERDRRLQVLAAATRALPLADKARKWFVTRGDLDYSALWILYAADPLARVEVIGRGELADREVVPRAMALNPAFFTRIYKNLLNAPKTRADVEAALDAVDEYLADRAATVFAPVIEHLREVGEARSYTEIDTHFRRVFGMDCVGTACEYLADRRLIGKAATPVRLTKKSSVEVQELAFFYIDPDVGPAGR